MSWDVRTNMKAKPGSQGSLFQGGSEQMTDAKWPRGYTPERLQQVRKVVGPGQRVFRDEPYLHTYDIAGEQRKLIDNIARSTVPGEHLQRLQFSPGKTNVDMTVGAGDSEMTAGGLYRKPQSPNPNHFGSISVRRGDADKPVAIHEIGHHASYLAGRPPLETVADHGREEGQADAYAQTHFRDRRGRPTDVEGYRYMRPDSVRTQDFFDAYHAVRPRTPTAWQPLSPQEIERRRQHLPGLDPVTVFKAGRKKIQP